MKSRSFYYKEDLTPLRCMVCDSEKFKKPDGEDVTHLDYIKFHCDSCGTNVGTFDRKRDEWMKSRLPKDYRVRWGNYSIYRGSTYKHGDKHVSVLTVAKDATGENLTIVCNLKDSNDIYILPLVEFLRDAKSDVTDLRDNHHIMTNELADLMSELVSEQRKVIDKILSALYGHELKDNEREYDATAWALSITFDCDECGNFKKAWYEIGIDACENDHGADVIAAAVSAVIKRNIGDEYSIRVRLK